MCRSFSSAGDIQFERRDFIDINRGNACTILDPPEGRIGQHRFWRRAARQLQKGSCGSANSMSASSATNLIGVNSPAPIAASTP
jgi:hypothetical protein